ncbi:MAG: hypothetical protein FJY80_00185, partial [Candidatus Aminicenantes bacterium]|nr:hypothetical protein [Candidatus Aminicenantes bacterium]
MNVRPTSLRTKIILSFLGVIVVGGLLSFVFGSRLIRETLITQAQAKIRYDLSSAWMVFNGRLHDIRDVVRLTAARESLREAVPKRDIGLLLRYLSRVRSENGLDVLSLIDANGRVLLRAHAPADSGDDVSGDDLVRFALEKRMVAAP